MPAWVRGAPALNERADDEPDSRQDGDPFGEQLTGGDHELEQLLPSPTVLL